MTDLEYRFMVIVNGIQWRIVTFCFFVHLIHTLTYLQQCFLLLYYCMITCAFVICSNKEMSYLHVGMQRRHPDFVRP